MANKKKPNKKPVNKKTVNKNISKMPDKRIIIIAAVCIALVIGAIIFLAVRGFGDGNKDAETTATTSVQATMNEQEAQRKALFEEHDALFARVRDVYWLGKYEDYKMLMPLEAWEALATEMEMTLEEVYAAVEEELSTMEIDGNDVKFYIASLSVMSGKEREEIATHFSNMYDIAMSDIGDICIMDIEMVHIDPDGTKESTDEIYYSFVIRGVRYLATENGFVG